MARDVTGTEVQDTTNPTDFLVIADVGGQTDIAKLPVNSLTTVMVQGLNDVLAQKADVGHTHPPTDPGDAATKEYVDEKYAAGVAQLVTLDARVTGVESQSVANAAAIVAITPTSIGAIANAEKGIPSGVATLGTDGVVPSSQLPAIGDLSGATPAATAGTIVKRDASARASIAAGTDAGHIVNKGQMEAGDAVVAASVTALSGTVSALTASSVGAIPTTEKGAVNGVATLAADGKVTPAQLPAAGGSIALTDKGAALGVATLDAAGKHVLTELQDGAVVEVTTTPYTITSAPGAVRAKTGAARIILPKTGSTRAAAIINDNGGTLEVIADEGIAAIGVKGNASRPTAEYAGIPAGLSTGRRGFTCSWWGYLDISQTQQRVISGYRNASTAYFELGLLSGAIGFHGADAAGATLNHVVSSWAPTAALHHFMMAADLTTSTFQLYINGSSQATAASPTWSNVDILWGTTKFAVCNVTSDGASSNGWYDDIFQVWFDDQFIDLSIAGNRLLFYNAGPVNLGHNGWRVTGTPPALFFNNTTFLKNLAAPSETWAAVAGRGSFGATTNAISGVVAAAVIVDQTGTSVGAVTLANRDGNTFAGSSDGLTWRQNQMGGALSSADRTKIDGIEAGAQVNPAALDNTAIDAGTATTPATITAAGLKRAAQQHAVSGIGARAITAGMMPEVAANSVLGNATGTPGNAASVAFSTLAVNIGSVPADQIVCQFVNPTSVVTVTAPTEERNFQSGNMQPWDPSNALTVIFFGLINTAGPAGTKIAPVYEKPLGSGAYYWFDGTYLGLSGAVVPPVNETTAGVVDAGASTGSFYKLITVPADAKGTGALKFGWRYYGGNGTGSLAVQGAALRLRSVLAGTGGGQAGVSSFNGRSGAVVPVSGDYNADQITDGAAKVMMTTSERSTLAGVTSVGSTAAEWFSNDPTLTNAGLKGSNTAAQNLAALQDLFTKMNASTADRKKLTIKAVDRGVFDIIGSFAPAGYDAGMGWPTAANLVIDFGSTQFNLQGTRTNYNQIRNLVTGTWQEIDATTAPANRPYEANTDIINASGLYQKQAVFFDIRGCPNLVTRGSLTINGTTAAGVVGIASSGSTPVGSGCKGAAFEHVVIQNMAIGMFADYTGATHAGDFENVSFQRLSFVNCGRAFVLGNGQANMLAVHNLDIDQTLASYVHGSQLKFGAANIKCRGAAQLAVGAVGWTPAPKGIEVSSCSIQIGSLQGEAVNSRGCFSIVNAAFEGVVDVGVLHQINANQTQSGTMLTMCQDDAAHLATVGTITVGGVAGSTEGNPGTAVIGIPAVAASARSVRMSMLGRAGMTLSTLSVIPDYRATAIGGASSDALEALETFSGREGKRVRRISAGAFVDVGAGGGGLITSVSQDFTAVGGLLALARIGKVQTYTAAATVGANEMFVLLKAPAAATFTLTNPATARGPVAISNRGGGTATISGGANVLHGGPILMPVPTSNASTSTICLWPDISDNSWRLA